MKTRMVTRFFHWRTEQTGVTQIWWVVKQKTASFQTYPFLSITHFTKFHLSIFFSRHFLLPFLLSGVSQITDPICFPSHTLPSLLLYHQERYWSLFFSSVLVENFLFQSQRNILTSKVTGTHHFLCGFWSPVGMKLWVCFVFVFCFWVWIGLWCLQWIEVGDVTNVIVLSCCWLWLFCFYDLSFVILRGICWVLSFRNGFGFFLCYYYWWIVDYCLLTFSCLFPISIRCFLL